jgi:hypothetical protein
LEYLELSLFTEMGIECFSMGAYINPEGNPALPRPAIQGMKRHPELEKFAYEFPKTNLPQELIDWADVVMVMNTPEWITENWGKIKGKKVIWRSIGQSLTNIENQLRPMRYEGMKIVRMSPMEKNIPLNLGEDAMIRFHDDPNDLLNWNGGTVRAMNMTQSLRARGGFCHYDDIMQIISSFPHLIYGSGNDNLGPANGGELPYDLLKGALRDNRAFVYGGTWPSPYTLSLIEAMMTGIPVVSIGPKLAEELTCVSPNDRYHFFEVPEFIKDGVNGFISDDITELRKDLDLLLTDSVLSEEMGKAGRDTAIKLFSKDVAKEAWKNFFNGL